MICLKEIAPLISTTVSFLFLFVGAVAIAAMMLRIGKADPSSPRLYTTIHRIAGWSFVALFAGMFLYMLTRVAHYNDEYSARITIHFSLAAALLCLLAIKIVVPRNFPYLGKHLFLLGSGVYVLAFPMVLISGGYHIEKIVTHEPYVYHDDFVKDFANDDLGKEFLINKCSTCHVLQQILKPRSGKAWEEVINRMVLLAKPRLSADEAGQILAYLEKHYAPKRVEVSAGASPIERHCFPCHAADEIYKASYSLVAWKAIIRKMSTYDGEIVPIDKVDQIAASLATAQRK